MVGVPSDLEQILAPGEEVELYIRQRIYHPKINIDSVVLTNELIILRHPHALGLRKDYTDYNYQDITNVVLDKGVLRSTIRLILRFGGEPLLLNDLPNSQAEEAYGIIRENVARYRAPFTAEYTDLPSRERERRVVEDGVKEAHYDDVCPKCGARVGAGQRCYSNCGEPLQHVHP